MAEAELSDYHPDTSLAGPSNQDPSIPNITVRGAASNAKERDPLAGAPEDVKGGSNLTTENVQRIVSDEERGAEGGDEGDDVAKPASIRKRRTRAEFASIGRPMSDKASSSGESDRIQGVQARHSAQRASSVGSRTSVPGPSVRPLFTQPQSSVISGNVDSTATETTSSPVLPEQPFDPVAERRRVREFFEQNGYMPAPCQSPDIARRRLRVIRRLGLENPSEAQRRALNRFTRLATTVFRTTGALVTIISRNRQLILSEIGIGGIHESDLDVAFCAHTIIGGHQCMVIQDTEKDWRFRGNPLVDRSAANPIVQNGGGPIRFYAGAPLVVEMGPDKKVIIGSMCVIDSHARQFSKHEESLLQDLAECVVSELELIYNQQSSSVSAKLHQISVDFLRRSLKNRPTEIAGIGRSAGKQTSTKTSSSAVSNGAPLPSSSETSSSQKRNQGSDRHLETADIDIYDEACREIRIALTAHAVAVVDLSQYHLFYPSYQNSSIGGSSVRGASTSDRRRPGSNSGSLAGASITSAITSPFQDKMESNKAKSHDPNLDPMAQPRAPQVLYIPNLRRRNGSQAEKGVEEPGKDPSSPDVNSTSMKLHLPDEQDVAVLGYSCDQDGFAFNFSNSPAARKVISDFIVNNVKVSLAILLRDVTQADRADSECMVLAG